MEHVFITGVSSGIGEALAELYLKLGNTVYGVARRTPYKLMEHERFHFQAIDLSRLDDIPALFESAALGGARDGGLDVAFLNAGVSGSVPARAEEFSLSELQHVLNVNVLANKILLDGLLSGGLRPSMCVLSASMAGVRFRGGTLPYSMSKAALAALGGVYADENPEVFFAVLGLCNVNTGLSRQVSFSNRTADFPALKSLQQRALQHGYMVSAAQRALDIHSIIGAPQRHGIESGKFYDIRSMLGGSGEVPADAAAPCLSGAAS